MDKDEQIKELEKKIDLWTEKNSKCYDPTQKALFDSKIKDAREKIFKLKEKPLGEKKIVRRADDPTVSENKHRGVDPSIGRGTIHQSKKGHTIVQI